MGNKPAETGCCGCTIVDRPPVSEHTGTTGVDTGTEHARMLRAHAKVNLTLEVLGKRPDGYHEIRSVFRRLALHDILRIDPAAALSVVCDVPGLDGPGNLAFRAGLLLQQETGHTGGARIAIAKAIPVAAGLGGGSSDAAAALRGLDALWGTALAADRLASLAARLGSDVPFFLLGGTALGSGRGEILQPLPDLPDCPVLLVRPPVAVSTAAVYGAVTAADYGDGAISARLAALLPGTVPERWPLANDLQPVTCRLYPVVAEVLDALHGWGALQTQMCGSGPTCFGLYNAEHAAERGAERARARGWDAWVTRFA